MGLLSLFKSKPPQPADRAAARTWRKTDFLAFSAGEDVHVVCTRDGTPQTLPSFAVDFAMGCRKFAPLEEHIAEHAAKHGWNTLQHEALQSWLPRMQEAGLLISSSQLRDQCAAMTGGGVPPKIGAIGFPTGGNRVPMLARAVESFAENLREHGRTADLLVADSSALPEQRAAYRARLAEISRTLSPRILYSGEEEKRRYADALARRSGCDPAAIEFALFDPLRTGFACGANRNALLLHEAGRMFCSVDDDVVCRLAAAPASDTRLSLFSACDPFERQLFPDRESALSAADFVAQDFLAAHEAMLGRDLGAIFDPTDALDVRHAGDDLLRRLELGAARIRMSFAGHVGDPGIPTSVYYLYYEGENRRRLTESEAHYRAVLGSRSVLAHAANAAVGDASVSPGMAMGLDHRELLPPFFPVLHAEDFTFGATAWQCCPRSVLGHLPFAILHEPGPGKTILLPGDLNRERRAVVFEFAHVIRRVILDYQPAEHAGASERMIALGRHLADLAGMPARDFTHRLRELTLEHESEKIDWMVEELEKDTESPDFWRQDVEAYLDHAREALAFEDFDIPFDLKGARTPEENRALMQEMFARYGALLQQWPAMRDAARGLNDAGGEWLFGLVR